MSTYFTQDTVRHTYPAVERTRNHGKHSQKVMAKSKSVCHICSGEYANTIDHIVPVAWGGSDNLANLAPAHTACNSSKGAAKYSGPDDYTWAKRDMWLKGFGPWAKFDANNIRYSDDKAEWVEAHFNKFIVHNDAVAVDKNGKALPIREQFIRREPKNYTKSAADFAEDLISLRQLSN